MPDLLIERIGTTSIFTLNRPEKRNALNAALITELKNAFREADAVDDLTAIVVRGAGKDFCSGADLESLQRIADASYEENLNDARDLAELFTIIRGVRMPVIAAVHGRALAGGCGLATACDMVVATPTARFGYPEVKIGFVPAMVAAILRRNLGEKESFALLTRGFELSAGEAVSIGLVNAVLNEESFDDDILSYAQVYEKISRSAVAMTKRLLYAIEDKDFATSLEHGAEVNAEARMSADCKNGIAKFLNKN